MFKWILVGGSVLLVAAFTLWQRDSVKTSYVNGLPQYTKLPGREYIFERDCYLFKLASHPTDYPLIAAHESVPELPATVDDKLIGSRPPGVRILDTVRTGTRFKIVSVRRDESRKGTQITFEILLLDETERKFPRLDAFFILDHSPEKTDAAPLVREDYAVLRVR
jgi:hypothetical protein